MKHAVYLGLFCIAVFLAGCDILGGANVPKYKITTTSLGDPILLNRFTGETWRLTENGWSPVVKLSKISVNREEPTLNEVEAEIFRRKKIYSILEESSDAKKIVLDYQLGVVKQEAARSKLQAFIPESLGALPPDIEKGNWKRASGAAQLTPNKPIEPTR